MRDFELPAQDERPVRLARELAGGAVVLVFYCGDWCPYCGGQLAELTGLYDEFRSAGAE